MLCLLRAHVSLAFFIMKFSVIIYFQGARELGEEGSFEREGERERDGGRKREREYACIYNNRTLSNQKIFSVCMCLFTGII